MLLQRVSEGDEEWETDSDSTTYEPVDGEDLYEEAGFSDPEDSKRGNKKKDKVKDTGSLGLKLSAQASSVLNRIGNRLGKIGKSRDGGADSDADATDEAFVDDVERSAGLSRSGSERSSGRRRHRDTGNDLVGWWSGVGWGGVVWLSRSGSERSSGRRRHRDTGNDLVGWWGGVGWCGVAVTQRQ